jgi:splicing factor 3B subunit 2
MNTANGDDYLSLLHKKIQKMQAPKKKKAKQQKQTDIARIQEELRTRLNAFMTSEPLTEATPVVDEVLPSESLLNKYKDVIDRFQMKGSRYYQRTEPEEDEELGESHLENNAQIVNEKIGDEQNGHPKQEEKKLTRKQQKELLKNKLAQLKVLVDRPDLVESWDITAPDPLLLIYLKSYKNTIEVPKHWSQKKKFLQTKRGAFKRAFRLPEFIENTGISKLRDPLSEISSLKMIRQKIKERMNPRLGKIDIDYQTLHDAFFKYQTKPKMSLFGDIYYEGKEEDQRMRTYRPGKLSPELRAALGISENSPAPWLLNMHKFGPPPAYPTMKISGLSLDAFKSFNDKNAKDKFVELTFEDENYTFGTLREDKLDDEEIGLHIENDYDEDNEDMEDYIKNQENPYFKLDVFQAE